MNNTVAQSSQLGQKLKLGQQLRAGWALVTFLLPKVKTGPTEGRRVAKTKSPVGPDKETEMFAMLQKAS
jgi:hypothetical protein